MIFWLIALILILCFGFVIRVGAPYLPTLSSKVSTALDLVDLQPSQTIIDLGCGDGKVLIAAAKRGWMAVGYELNPILYVICLIRTWRYKHQIKVIWGNYWLADWPPAEAIFAFILPKYMKKLDKKIMQYSPKSLKLVSFAFPIPNRLPTTQQEGLFLYVYPPSLATES